MQETSVAYEHGHCSHIIIIIMCTYGEYAFAIARLALSILLNCEVMYVSLRHCGHKLIYLLCTSIAACHML